MIVFFFSKTTIIKWWCIYLWAENVQICCRTHKAGSCEQDVSLANTCMTQMIFWSNSQEAAHTHAWTAIFTGFKFHALYRTPDMALCHQYDFFFLFLQENTYCRYPLNPKSAKQNCSKWQYILFIIIFLRKLGWIFRVLSARQIIHVSVQPYFLRKIDNKKDFKM